MEGSTKSAAFRLRHDLGKSVRWNAPGEPESDPEALRARLKLDLAATRKMPDITLDAVALFDSWRREEGALFLAPDLATPLRRVEEAVGTVRRLLPRIDELKPAALRELDDATVAIADGTAALFRRAASEAPE